MLKFIFTTMLGKVDATKPRFVVADLPLHIVQLRNLGDDSD